MTISIIGAGPGKREYLTVEAGRLIEEADILIGADRVTGVFGADKLCFNIYKPEEILSKIKNTGIGKNIAVLLTGDPGFYSSAKKLFKLLDGDSDLKGTEINIVPGISSMQYLCENLHLTWENICFTSLHGRDKSIIGQIKRNPKVFTLLSSGEDLREIADKLHHYGMDHVKIVIGERLSYPDENITVTDSKNFSADVFTIDKLSAALFINNKARDESQRTIADEEFIRGDVPMTKSEVRTISLSKLMLEKDSRLYDIGAGTGSISVEASMKVYDGEVYAIEKKSEALDLIKENKKKFSCDNIKIVDGSAPEILSDLPDPTHVFIGGSGGRIKDIIDACIKKNPEVRIVINIVSLDTLEEVNKIISERNLKSDICLVNITRIRENAGHRMMTGLNPVYVVSLEPADKGENRDT